MIAVRSLLGVGPIPTDRTSAGAWLKRNGIPTLLQDCSGGQREMVSLLDLPEPVQLDYRLRQAEEAGLTYGEQDDAAHVELLGKPVGVQEAAHARAAILALVHKHRQAGLKWPQIVPLFKSAGFGEGPSEKTIKRWFKQVEGVDPANWAPALAPEYQGRSVKAPMTDEAWLEFCAKVAAHGRNGTGANFRRIWKQVEDKKSKFGWQWPSYVTVLREFQRLTVEEQRALTKGEDEAAKSITIRLERSVEGLFAMEQVELDGREFKVKVRF
jgi:putative transposase